MLASFMPVSAGIESPAIISIINSYLRFFKSINNKIRPLLSNWLCILNMSYLGT